MTKRKAKKLTEEQILAWADAHHERTGQWPSTRTGEVGGTPGEDWHAVNQALSRGSRGLPGGSSLANLLAERRGKRNQFRLPRLTVKQILEWADRHFEQTGAWPNQSSGPVPDAPGEKWVNVDAALKAGHRGFPGGDSLAKLLDRYRRGERG